MSRQWFIPGGGLIDDDGDKDYFIPGVGMFNEVASSVTLIIPLNQFNLNGQIPSVEIHIIIAIPLNQFNITALDATLQFGVAQFIPLAQFNHSGVVPDFVGEQEKEVFVPLFQFNMAALDAVVHNVDSNALLPESIDLTPPFDQDQMRYLYHNFSLLSGLLGGTIDQFQFTTADGTTVLVRNGLIVEAI